MKKSRGSWRRDRPRKGSVPENIDLVGIDSSFIALVNIIPKAIEFIGESGSLVALIKPRFKVENSGAVRDEAKQKSVVEKIK